MPVSSLLVLVCQGAIEELFDVIDYNKGASVVRMVASTIDLMFGSGNWDAAVALYLRTHAFSNAASADLWAAVANITACGRDHGGGRRE